MTVSQFTPSPSYLVDLHQPFSACYYRSVPSHRLLDSSRTSTSLLCLPSLTSLKTSQNPRLLPTTPPRRRLYQLRQDEVSQDPLGALDPASTLLSRFGSLARQVGGNKIILRRRLRLCGWILRCGSAMSMAQHEP